MSKGRPSAMRRAWSAYRQRWKRRKLLWRCMKAGRALSPLVDRTGAIRPGDILCFATVRNEMLRLPQFLDHYRGLGVTAFLIVDNASTDGTDRFLRDRADVSLWRAAGGYRASRFGMDWLGALLLRHGHGHWCLTVDADELLIYPHWDSRPLPDLVAHLDAARRPAMGAMMLDLYPQGPLDRAEAPADAPLTEQLPWFDAAPYRCEVVHPKRNRILRGGVRERVFFPDDPRRGPTLNKLPLVRWDRRYVYVNSTHSLLPPRLNDEYDGPGDPRLSGILLHGKFLPDSAARAAEELRRAQHFIDPPAYRDYHASVARAPVLWHEGSVRYRGWGQLQELGLMGRGDWFTTAS
ncbi:glycosyltransferase family 2 protein [Paracoccus sp. (in: a-proteobacteria)]|uniref:glycosyltransferase family 2 protein n=1 Tax=Paracoccus sp. TaxID=267 RepID=UPI0035B38981